jgi:hypothetical protein
VYDPGFEACKAVSDRYDTLKDALVYAILRNWAAADHDTIAGALARTDKPSASSAPTPDAALISGAERAAAQTWPGLAATGCTADDNCAICAQFRAAVRWELASDLGILAVPLPPSLAAVPRGPKQQFFAPPTAPTSK